MSAAVECDDPSVDKTTPDSEEEDSHRCGTCKLEFGSIEDFIKHKLDKDNCRVFYQKSTKDKRVLVPRLIKKEAKDDEERETRGSQKRKRKTYFSVDQENIVEKTSHKCPKCSRTFNREATLRRHLDIEHDSTWEIVNDEIGRDEEETGKGPAVTTLLQAAAEEENSTAPVVEMESPESTVFQVKRMKTSSNEDRPFACEVCDSKFKEMSVLKTHLLTHSDQRDFPCPFEGCTYAFKTKGSLKRHERRHTGDRPYICHLCQRSFAESGALTRHLKSRTPCTSKSDADLPRYGRKIQITSEDGSVISNETAKPSSKEGEENEDQSVRVLRAAASAADGVTTEMMTSDNPAVSTALTSVDGQSGETTVVTTLTSDEAKGQGEDFSLEDGEEDDKFEQLEPNQCRVCKAALANVDTLIEHLKTHLSGLPFRCGSCNFCTDKKEYLAGHMKERHRATLREIGPDGNEADVVPTNPPPMNSYLFRLSKEGSMAAKQLLTLGEKSAVEDPSAAGYKTFSKCPVCGRTFKGSSYLKLHMRSHTGERPHQCPHCPKTFTTKDTLSKHLTAHSEARHYKCGECGKLFKRISHVKEHLKIHTNERPYKCTFCDKTFKTTNACKVHLRTHGSVMPWECKFCHRLFREKGSLERHVRTHTGEKPYSCQYCGRKFAEHGTLNRHLKAKAPCTQQLRSVQETQEEDVVQNSLENNYPTVLAQFSSVVTDTQHYILEGQEEDMTDTQPAAEYVVVDSESNIQVQNIEVVGTAQDNTTQYVILNQPDGNTIAVATSDPTSILDSLSSMASMSTTPTMTTVTASGQVPGLTSDDVTIVTHSEELPDDVLEGLVATSGGEVTQVVQGLETHPVNIEDAVVGLVDS
ncbi:transcription factor E4F1 [Lingula anatina]|uniref:Transcription factor E4F1 n=1 Tax=Lingula anatina TaxID=7574 RepID=A0A1S3HZZ7_LINAN|nr:transcription factor E4F1 [Lingula anatina]|eukprot:XP_013391583.1 transcription factor E4F1 [Lingula anatina]